MDVEMFPQMQIDQQSSSSTNDKTQENLIPQANRAGSSQAQEEIKASAGDQPGTILSSMPEEGELQDFDTPMKPTNEGELLSKLRKIDERELVALHSILKNSSAKNRFPNLQLFSQIPRIVRQKSCQL